LNEAALIALAQEVLTTRQFEVWKLSRVNGWSQQTIAYHMDVAKSTVGGTLKRAEQKLELAQRKEDDNGPDPAPLLPDAAHHSAG
jgi:DNA-directed RNA polymerase specialized sigma24 family protein